MPYSKAMDTLLFDQFLEDNWSTDPCESKSINTDSNLCPDYSWLNQYNPTGFNFEDMQTFDDLDSCNLSSPQDFNLPSPISETSSLTAEARHNQNSLNNPWLISNLFENNTSTSTPPLNSPSISAPSLASSPSSSEADSPWADHDHDKDVEPKKSKTSMMRTAKGRTQSSSTSGTSSRGKSPSPICKRQNNAHNQIEKRYRNNLNSKINALKNCIPALSSVANSKDKEEEDEDENGDSGERRKVVKCNKGIILDKAIQYIAELEKDVARLRKENEGLKKIFKGSIPDYLLMGLNKAMVYA